MTKDSLEHLRMPPHIPQDLPTGWKQETPTDRIESMQLDVDELRALKQQVKELVDQLRCAEIFINQHSEPWYRSGQRLLAEVRAVLAKHTTPQD
jgi:hypothetical protein